MGLGRWVWENRRVRGVGGLGGWEGLGGWVGRFGRVWVGLGG